MAANDAAAMAKMSRSWCNEPIINTVESRKNVFQGMAFYLEYRNTCIWKFSVESWRTIGVSAVLTQQKTNCTKQTIQIEKIG